MGQNGYTRFPLSFFHWFYLLMISALSEHWENIVLCYITLHGLYTKLIMNSFLFSKSTSLILFLYITGIWWRTQGPTYYQRVLGFIILLSFLYFFVRISFTSFFFINAFEMFVLSTVNFLCEKQKSLTSWIAIVYILVFLIQCFFIYFCTVSAF